MPRDRPLDFTRDPVPDLALEIEYTRPVADRLRVFAALGVPELWVYNGARLRILLLTPTGYEEGLASRSLPSMPLDLVAELLPRVTQVPGPQVVGEFLARLPKE